MEILKEDIDYSFSKEGLTNPTPLRYLFILILALISIVE